jgi:hypothetical protein
MSVRREPSQKGAALFIVLAIGVVIAVVLFAVLTQSGHNRAESVKEMISTREFYLADAGFNWLKTKITSLNQEGGAKSVETFLGGVKQKGWMQMQFGKEGQGYFQLKAYQVTPAPLSVELTVQGRKDPKSKTLTHVETVSGTVRVPSMARYARYVEGNNPISYTSGTVVDGEILIAGNVNLVGTPVQFTRLVSTGGKIINRNNGKYDFGFREEQKNIPTLNGVHVNSWDNFPSPFTETKKTFEFLANNGGVHFYGPDPGGFPAWSGLNKSRPCKDLKTGPCDTLFTTCFDTLASTRRSPAVVVGSAMALDLSSIVVKGNRLEVTVAPVIYDAGADGKDYFILGKPSRTYSRNYDVFKNVGVLYFPGDIYLTGRLKSVPVTVVAGDDIFLYGGWVGPTRTEVDANKMPVTLGVIAQDQIFIHESASREITIRAAMLAENDEITYTSKHDPNFDYGYVCTREIFQATRLPNKGDVVDFAAYFKQNFIWDNHRIEFPGMGREPNEECVKANVCNNKDLDRFGFVALGFPRKTGTKWNLTFEGALITRQPGSKGPGNDCTLGWDCDSDPKRSTWRYDDNLGVAYPPKFPAPVLDDRNPTQVLGYKRQSFAK